MAIHQGATNADELAGVIDVLADDVSRMRSQGQLSVHDAQQVASSLTQVQLALNELERVELRERGVSREMAERFASLEHRLRAIQDDLYRGLRSTGTAGARKGGDAYDPAGR